MNRTNKARKNAWVRSKAVHCSSESIRNRYGVNAALLNDGRFRTNPYRHHTNRTWKLGLTVWFKRGGGFTCWADTHIPHLMMLAHQVKNLHKWAWRY